MKKITLWMMVIFMAISGSLLAQKLPNVQQVSLRAPTNIRVDGKAIEWGQFKAHNSATDLWYSIANDEKNLYLSLKATDGDVINRIVGGGITFKITNKDIKGDEGVSITYPIKNTGAILYFDFSSAEDQMLDTIEGTADSVMKTNNQRLASNFKFIQVKGIKDIDTLSIYNQNGIEAAGAFDKKRAYIIELSIPRELLSKEINTADTFSYQICVNGGPPNSFHVDLGHSDPAMKAQMEDALAAATFTLESRTTTPTSFISEYTLAK